MYKIVIVDDEEEVRLGMIQRIMWSDYHFEVIGEAENGREALEIFEDAIPDVVITDICMPLMDGLELASYIREHYPTVKTIILTGFEDFKFAKQAIKYGVIDYLLKPVLPKDIHELLTKLRGTLDNEIQDKEDRTKLQKHYIESLPVLKESFLTSLILGRHQIKEIEQKITAFDLRITGAYFAVAVIRLDTEHMDGRDASPEDIELKRFAVSNIAREILDKNELGEAFFYGETPVVVIGVENEEKATVVNKLFMVLEEIRQNVEKFLKITITTGLGSIQDRVDGIKKSYESALTALEYKLVLGGNQIIYVEDLEPETKDSIYLDEKQEEMLVSSIKFGSKDDVTQAVNALFDTMGQTKLAMRDYELYFMEIKTVLLKLSRTFQIDLNDEKHSGMCEDIHAFNSLGEAKAWFAGLCLKLMQAISSKRVNTTQTLFDQAKDYIDTHYGDHELNMQKLAKHLYISASYLGMIFKKEAGETFLKYLIRVRLEAAKELLKNPKTKISEAAEKVGYPDVSYFSYFFKKNTGQSPREYRNRFA